MSSYIEVHRFLVLFFFLKLRLTHSCTFIYSKKVVCSRLGFLVDVRINQLIIQESSAKMEE